jgi:hypothetical protein
MEPIAAVVMMGGTEVLRRRQEVLDPTGISAPSGT